MRVDELSNVVGAETCDVFHVAQHLGGQTLIEQRIDKKRFAAIGNQAGVAVAPRSGRLQVSEMPAPNVMQSLGEFRHAHPQTSRQRRVALAATPMVRTLE
jgi:hypothetical protein